MAVKGSVRSTGIVSVFRQGTYMLEVGQKLPVKGLLDWCICDGQRHVILSPIEAHYKWPQNKIYSHVS